VEIGCRVYKPRRPRESPLYRLVERHLEELLRVWPERFARCHGPLRAVVERVLREFLRCGLLEHGFARLWCGSCRRSVLVAFSCRGRSFCPSCEKKKQLLWAEWLRGEVLAEVAHRHVVLTIPHLLRPLFRRRRELLKELARAGAEAVQELVRLTCGSDARPGVAVSVATAGDLLQWHPHLHLITADAGRTRDGSLARAAAVGRGSAHNAVPRAPAGQARREARHLERAGRQGRRLEASRLLRTRGRKDRCRGQAAPRRHGRLPGAESPFPQEANPLSLKKLVYLDGQTAVLYRSKRNPLLGRNFEAMDPVEWLARLSDHIPDPASTARCSTASTRTASGVSLTLPRPKSARWPSSRHASAARRVGHA
jgi:hypothetical protein